jgi:DNA mismatch repair protein MSH5
MAFSPLLLIVDTSDREIEIVEDLLSRILGYGEVMGNSCDVCAELDCLLSFAEASRMYDYRRPCMVEDNIIDIKGGRFVIHFI